MKKTTFYTLHRSGAVEKNGYTDGTYNYYYYSDCKTWHAIHPRVGLSVANADTRKLCAEIAHERREAVAAMEARDGEKLARKFENAIQAAREVAQ